MIYIISGDDFVVSRNQLNEVISADENITKINGKTTSIEQISKALFDGNLFSSKLTIVIEYYTKIKPIESLITALQQAENNKNIKIVLWDEAPPAIKIANSIKNAQISTFPFPKVYFNFLDNISPGASSETLNILRDVLKTYSAEQILFSIIKRIRQLLIVKSGNFRSSREFQTMQEWQVARLQKQANLWTKSQLEKSLESYLELDERIKTSTLTMDLTSHLDILLISDLN